MEGRSFSLPQKDGSRRKYRMLKRKLNLLVHEHESFRQRLENAQQILLQTSRDKSFLLDRLLKYEKVPLSSDEESTAPSEEENETEVRPAFSAAKKAKPPAKFPKTKPEIKPEPAPLPVGDQMTPNFMSGQSDDDFDTNAGDDGLERMLTIDHQDEPSGPSGLPPSHFTSRMAAHSSSSLPNWSSEMYQQGSRMPGPQRLHQSSTVVPQLAHRSAKVSSAGGVKSLPAVPKLTLQSIPVAVPSPSPSSSSPAAASPRPLGLYHPSATRAPIVKAGSGSDSKRVLYGQRVSEPGNPFMEMQQSGSPYYPVMGHGSGEMHLASGSSKIRRDGMQVKKESPF
eukprot:m.15957 g.15957  ORF g.15957 m.15957 type:complete len:339 (+) comp26644_c0_seq2:29-1045(+)